MAKTNDPAYLKAEDLLRDGKWCEYTLTIAEVTPAGTVKAADGNIIDRPIIRFEKAEKLFIVGKTSERLLKYATGSALQQEWVGKAITVAAYKGDWYGEKNIAALRVKLQPTQTRPSISRKHLGVCLTGTKTEVTSAASN